MSSSVSLLWRYPSLATADPLPRHASKIHKLPESLEQRMPTIYRWKRYRRQGVFSFFSSLRFHKVQSFRTEDWIGDSHWRSAFQHEDQAVDSFIVPHGAQQTRTMGPMGPTDNASVAMEIGYMAVQVGAEGEEEDADGSVVDEVHNVFVYGTLLADELLMALLKRVPESALGYIKDYHRYSIIERPYPAAYPLPGGKIDGRILLNLTKKELEILDWYEDDEYIRSEVDVVIVPQSGSDGGDDVSSLVASSAQVEGSVGEIAVGAPSGSTDVEAAAEARKNQIGNDGHVIIRQGKTATQYDVSHAAKSAQYEPKWGQDEVEKNRQSQGQGSFDREVENLGPNRSGSLQPERQGEKGTVEVGDGREKGEGRDKGEGNKEAVMTDKETEKGTILKALLYVFQNRFKPALHGDWDYLEFRRKHLREYIDICSECADLMEG